VLQELSVTSQLSCCILIPVYKAQWRTVEHAAIRRCLRILRNYDFVFMHKQSLHENDIFKHYRTELDSVASWRLMPVPDECLASVHAYNKLLLTSCFYDFFYEWDYLLVFQHDAWILSGNLENWLDKRYSYVGAPWCPDLGDDPLWSPVPGVGNGGLSLRKIKDMKSIVSSEKFYRKPVLSMFEIISKASLFSEYQHRSMLVRALDFLKRLLCLVSLLLLYPIGYRNNLAFLAANGVNEDIILGFYAKRLFKWLHVPSPREAASFSLETNPRRVAYSFCVGIPFGCHAWEKYDKDFFMARYSQCFEEHLHSRP